MTKVCLVLSPLLLLLLLVSCAPGAAPAPAPQAAAPPSVSSPAQSSAPVASAASATRPAWETKWAETLAAAKKEGRVSIHTGGGAGVRTSLTEIAQKQGIDAEVVTARGDEFVVRIQAERRAGLYLHDIWISGPGPMLSSAKPAGLMQSIEPALILPDVTDPDRIKKVWYKGELPWVDRDRMSFVSFITAQTPIVINTNLVRDGEIKSWRDLLDPKWKGKIIVNDPSVSGAGQLGLAAIDGIMGWDYVKELSRMDVTVMRDQRLQLEWLAHGKASVLVPPKPDALREFLKLGLPIKALVPSEGTWVSPGSSGLGLILKEAHPNAAKVFINGLLSQEGQKIFAVNVGFQSAREDVTTTHLRPEDIRQEGVKYFNGYGEEFSAGARRVEVNKLLKDLFGPMVR